MYSGRDRYSTAVSRYQAKPVTRTHGQIKWLYRYFFPTAAGSSEPAAAAQAPITFPVTEYTMQVARMTWLRSFKGCLKAPKYHVLALALCVDTPRHRL